MEPEEKENRPGQRLADKLWEKILEENHRDRAPDSKPAMDFNDRHTQFAPTLILDFDNGEDFTFKGMGLKGNRPQKIKEEK